MCYARVMRKKILPEVAVAFEITAPRGFDLNQISKIVGLRSTFRSDEPGGEDYQDALWVYELFPEREKSLERRLQQLLKCLWPKRKRILRFLHVNRLTAEFTFHVNHVGDHPDYVLSAKSLERMAWFKAAWRLVLVDVRDA